MNNTQESRNWRSACLSTALLSLALVAGTASVGHAQEIESLVVTAERPVHTDFAASIRDEMRSHTEAAVWMTRIDVGTDLGLKLGRPSERFHVAATDMNKRG